MDRFFLTMLASLLAATAAGVESFPLVCRGGSSAMTGIMETYKVNELVGHTITVKFKRGDTGSNPAKGECVWVERGLLSREPAEFRYSQMEWNQTYFVGAGVMNITKGPIKYIADSIQSSRVFYLEAYNTDRGYLLVTKFGP